ncbi:MAG TPA: sigma factor, partial [Usitatibacter sp.]|nr:sigma factor [Usitatibacter sp.]
MQTAPRPVADTKTPDPELARMVADGDREALKVMMKRHNQALFRTARAILKDDEEAEDSVQETWLHAYRSMGTFRGD